METAEIQKGVSAIASRAWRGQLIVGMILGVIAGLAIGYKLDYSQTVAIPMGDGIRT
jgi:hypothetical protein